MDQADLTLMPALERGHELTGIPGAELVDDLLDQAATRRPALSPEGAAGVALPLIDIQCHLDNLGDTAHRGKRGRAATLGRWPGVPSPTRSSGPRSCWTSTTCRPMAASPWSSGGSSWPTAIAPISG